MLSSLRGSSRPVSSRLSCHIELLLEWVTPVVAGILYLILSRREPFKRDFALNDMSIGHKMAEKERIPMWLLGVCIFFFVFLGTRFVPFIKTIGHIQFLI